MSRWGVLVGVLGPIRAWRDGQEVGLGPPGRRVVLGLLALAGGRAVRRGDLVEALWGERPPASATNVIQTHVKHLRRLLDPERDRYARGSSIRTVGDGYALRIPRDGLDLQRFRGLAALAGGASRTGAHERAAQLLAEALGLWRGPPLADLPGLAAHPKVVALLGERRQALIGYAAAMIEIGRAERVLPMLTESAASHPLDEGLQALCVRAHAAAGQRAMALAVYENARARLDTEPGPELSEAYAALRPAGPGPGRAATSPAQLPADVPDFTGRATELAELDGLVEGSDVIARGIAAVCGTAGVGKTALIVHWGHRMRERFPDGQLYLDLRGQDPDHRMSTSDALTRFLEALGVAGQDIPIEEDARAARYRTALADRRMLIVLDNASSFGQVQALLPGTPSCVVVVTSRDSLAGLVMLYGAHRIDLDPLPAADAISLLHKLIGEPVHREPAAADTLARQCVRLPLPLRVAGSLAARRPETPLPQLVRERAPAAGDARVAIRAVLSWSYEHLPADAARLFRRLGWHPARTFDPHAAAALGRLDLPEAGRLLGALVRANLVDRGPHGHYGMHDLIRAYATELADAEPLGERPTALGRLLDYYLAAAAAAMDVLYPAESAHRPPVRAPDVSLPQGNEQSWLDAELPTLVEVCGFADEQGWPAHAARLSAVLYRYLENGHHSEALAVHTHGLRAARAIGDRSGEAHALTNLGAVHLVLGRPAGQLREALVLHGVTGDRFGEARTLAHLGVLEDSAEHLQRALASYQELGDRRGAAATLANLGTVRGRAGDHAGSAEALYTAWQLFDEAGDRSGAAMALRDLGEADLRLGRYAAAEEHLRGALTTFRDLEHRHGQAAVLSTLSRVHSRTHRHGEAIELSREALEIFRACGHRDGEANCLNVLGEALHATGQPGALASHTAALEIATETGDRDEQDRAAAGIARCRG